MPIKNPSIKVAFMKNLPVLLGGDAYFDSLLEDRDDLTSPHKAWTAFHQQFVNDVFNHKKNKRPWTAVPHLNPVDCPCYPGSVIVSQYRSLSQCFLRREPNAFFAGPITDFYPQERTDKMEFPLSPKHQEASKTIQRRVYQSKSTEMAVVITCVAADTRSLEVEKITSDNTFINMDNFEYSGFESDHCHLVTSVLTAESLKVEVTLDGRVFYEHTYTGSVPICFRAMKIYTVEEGKGLVSRMKPIRKLLPLKLKSKRTVQNYLNVYIPNQSKFGKAVGDYPPVIRLHESVPIRSYRRKFLPRPDRPCLSPPVTIYFKTDAELKLLRTLTSPELLIYHSSTQKKINEADTAGAEVAQ